MKRALLKFFKYRRTGLYLHGMKLIGVDRLFRVTFKVREINTYGSDTLVEILDVFSMDTESIADNLKATLIENALRVIPTEDISWENE